MRPWTQNQPFKNIKLRRSSITQEVHPGNFTNLPITSFNPWGPWGLQIHVFRARKKRCPEIFRGHGIAEQNIITNTN